MIDAHRRLSALTVCEKSGVVDECYVLDFDDYWFGFGESD
jgi:hypothetical protein